MARRFMSGYQCVARYKKTFIKRTAKYAPQLLADGLTYGVTSTQGNLVHGIFDDDGSTKVDPMSDIMSDKFTNMQKGLDTAKFDLPNDINDPIPPTPTTE